MNDKIKYFFPKVLNRLAHEKNRIWEHLPVEKISLWGMGRVPSKEEFTKRLQEMLGEFTPEFFAEIDSQERETIISCADNALNHDFDLLGSGLMHLDPIPWHSDFKSGFTWPKGVFYRYQRGNTLKGSDIKVPWELSRCHHLLWLGEAYLISSDETYAQEVVEEINNWIDENPFMYSVNWTCSMEAAFRSVNWMYSCAFISKSQFLTDKFISKVYKSLYQHSFFIRNNLERAYPFSNNHYYSDLAGLVFLQGLFWNIDEYRYKSVINKFFKETITQVYKSGIHYEKSISYHRLVTEISLASFYLFKRIKINVPQMVIDRIKKMSGYIAYYSDLFNNAPLVADNDNGRFLPFVYRDFNKHRYLCNNASAESRILSFNCDNLSPQITLEYNECGFLYRNNKNASLLLLNEGNGGIHTNDKVVMTHTHNDLLSIILNIKNEEFLIDPGSSFYTSNPQLRDEFRSTSKHNTVIVDNEEQNLFINNKPFFIKKNSIIDSAISYHTIGGNMHHKRKCVLNEDHLDIEDIVSKNGLSHKVVLYYHLAAGFEASVKENIVVCRNNKNIVFITFLCGKAMDISINDDTFSPSYGIVQKSKTIRVSLDFDYIISIKTIINWKNG